MSEANITEAQKVAMSYIADNKIEEQIQQVVNSLLAAKPADAYGYLANEFSKLAQPPAISKLVGREVLDSRGNPTVEVDVYAHVQGAEKIVARQASPSGASTGSNEACELRDGDAARYLGKGTTKAAANVAEMLSTPLAGMQVNGLDALDAKMREVDGTELKTNVGGNGMTAASFALAAAGAEVQGVELYEYLSETFHGSKEAMPTKYSLPRPMVNILNGGKHAGGNLKLQEFMIVPAGGKPFAETIRHAAEVYHHLGKILVAKYGPSAKNLGDEGGYAPPLDDPDEALALLEQAVEAAGLVVGVDMFFAIDAAASEFYEEAKGDKPYEVRPDQWISSDELVAFYVQMKKDHPGLISIEDGMDEKDYTGWINLTAAFDEQFPDTIIVGDDLFTTNTNLISKGLEAKWANALLLKVNQIGTISESMAAARLLFAQKGMVAVSHRSGETVSSVISDLAVGIGAQFIKTGATARGERVCKYNRLLAIEEHLRENGKI